MKCPHCLVEVNEEFETEYLGLDAGHHVMLEKMNCPNSKCGRLIVKLAGGTYSTRTQSLETKNFERFVLPLSASRAPAPPEVDKHIAEDFNEAALIQGLSLKASATLSRRCLQNILREKAGIKKGDLAAEIAETMSNGNLPTYLSESIDAIRNIGNFAAHPIKSSSSGTIVLVEPDEAEWLLDVLEALMDFYYVQPAALRAKREKLNNKLLDAGKPPMK